MVLKGKLNFRIELHSQPSIATKLLRINIMGCILKLRDGREVFVSIDLFKIFNPHLYKFSQTINKQNIFVAIEDKKNRDM